MIIVVVIIAILWTIAFFSFWDYTLKTRDSVRLVDFNNIKKAIELYFFENGEVPISSNFTDYDKIKWWKKWTLDEEISKKINLSKVPLDPKDNTEYIFLVSEDKKQYILNIPLESWETLKIGNIQNSCENIKLNWQFHWDWIYTIYHMNLEPRKVFCKEWLLETFHLSTVGWDMEIIDWNPENSKFTSFLEKPWFSEYTTEEKYNWERSLKVSQSWFLKNNLTYITYWQKYKMSWWFKIIPKNPDKIDEKSCIYFDLLWWYTIESWKIKQYNNRSSFFPFIETETVLSRDVKANDDKIFFKCDKKIYDAWNSAEALNFRYPMVFDIDKTWKQLDIPNWNLYKFANYWQWVNPKFLEWDKFFWKNFWDISWFLEVDWWADWWNNPEEKKECSMRSHYNIWKDYKAWTWIRRQKTWKSLRLWSICVWSENYWKWFYFEKILDPSKTDELSNFSKFEKFVRAAPFLNYWERKWTSSSDTITYVDDFLFEIHN